MPLEVAGLKDTNWRQDMDFKRRITNQYRRYLKAPSMTGVRSGRCQGLMDAVLILLGPKSPEFVALKGIHEGAKKEGLVL